MIKLPAFCCPKGQGFLFPWKGNASVYLKSKETDFSFIQAEHVIINIRILMSAIKISLNFINAVTGRKL